MFVSQRAGCIGTNVQISKTEKRILVQSSNMLPRYMLRQKYLGDDEDSLSYLQKMTIIVWSPLPLLESLTLDENIYKSSAVVVIFLLFYDNNCGSSSQMPAWSAPQQ